MHGAKQSALCVALLRGKPPLVSGTSGTAQNRRSSLADFFSCSLFGQFVWSLSLCLASGWHMRYLQHLQLWSDKWHSVSCKLQALQHWSRSKSKIKAQEEVYGLHQAELCLNMEHYGMLIYVDSKRAHGLLIKIQASWRAEHCHTISWSSWFRHRPWQEKRKAADMADRYHLIKASDRLVILVYVFLKT